MATQSELDLVFAMDCTGSMGSYIAQARDNINTIVETIVAKEHADVRIALVEYRDHPPQDFQEFVTRVLDFTGSVREVRARLDQCRAAGGGDTPEAVADALHDLLKLSWREGSTKICVFISDAPPHALGGCTDGFPDGCPCGLDPMAVAQEVAAKGITIYMVGCEPSVTPYREWFMGVALLTGGQYVPLGHANLLSQVIISGAQEALSLQTLMAEVDADVRAQLEGVPDGAAPADQAAVEAEVYKRMKERGSKTKHLRSDVGELPAVTVNAIAYSEMGAMKDVSKHYSKVTPPPQTQYNTRRSLAHTYGPGASDAMTSRGELVSSAASADSAGISRYATVDDAVSYSQCRRLVQKSLVTNNLKSKCSQKTFDDVTKKS